MIPLPHCLDVERESGWLGVEVPGKLHLEEKERFAIVSIDVRQLPEEMVRSAVSPILKGYRYHKPEASIHLLATSLPEGEPSSGSIDRVRAFTKVTSKGNVISELNITLRNRLRHSLYLNPPPDAQVRSVVLDGQPFNPSRTMDGFILLPLKRSIDHGQLKPFTISIVLESSISPFGWFGLSRLSLPTIDLPISSFAWSIFLPARNIYSQLKGEIKSQEYCGLADWYKPSFSGNTSDSGQTEMQSSSQHSIAQSAISADAGAMPVRIKVPKEGMRLDYSRYWIEGEQHIKISCFYLRSWLRIPLWILLAILFATGMLISSTYFYISPPPKFLPWFGVGLCIIIVWPAYRIGGFLPIVFGVAMGLIAVGYYWHLFDHAPASFSEWASTLHSRFQSSKTEVKERTVRGTIWQIIIICSVGIFGLMLLHNLSLLLFLLLKPLGGGE
ncbi:MAG: hypothetical protein ACMUIP_01475 [bacterium]